MKRESLNASLPSYHHSPSFEGILNEDGGSQRESLLDSSAKHKYDGKPGLFTLIEGTLIKDEESP